MVSFWGADAGAVLISTADGTGNTTNPGFYGWEYVGDVNGLSATYLGNGWVITADHVGPGDFVLDGTVYSLVAGSEARLESNPSTLADLVMFAVQPYPALDPLVIRSTPPPLGELLIMIGCGRDRGPNTNWESLVGWDWGSSSSKRWGTNRVEELTIGLVLGTVSFYTSFDDNELLPEAQAAGGDSGGAVFSINGAATELAGIIYAIGPTPGQPADTALFTNLTFVARLDFYNDQIESVTALPEPTMGLSLTAGIGLLMILNRRRKRTAGPGRLRFLRDGFPTTWFETQFSAENRSSTWTWREFFLS